jgi:hypothetical protein
VRDVLMLAKCTTTSSYAFITLPYFSYHFNDLPAFFSIEEREAERGQV